MSKSHTSILLKNLGIEEDFLERLEDSTPYFTKKSNIIRIYSEDAIAKIPTNTSLAVNDQEEGDIYDDVEEHYNNFKDADFCVNYIEKEEEEPVPEKEGDIVKTSAEDQLSNLKIILSQMNEENEKVIIKAYKSKLKSKYYEIYEKNSQQLKEMIKYKMFHKCNYPSCKRTFASSGWLRSHFNEHLRDLKKNRFNILFDRYIENLRK